MASENRDNDEGKDPNYEQDAMDLFLQAMAKETSPDEVEAARRYLASERENFYQIPKPSINEGNSRTSSVTAWIVKHRRLGAGLILLPLVACTLIVGWRWIHLEPIAPKNPTPTFPTSKVATDQCLKVIRLCGLPDGSIRVKSKNKDVWIQPRSANLASLALLAGGEPGDRPQVLDWLTWYASRQNQDGSIEQFDGTLGLKISKISREAVAPKDGKPGTPAREPDDTFPATHLLLVRKYQQVTKSNPPVISESAKKSLNYILTNSINAKYKYLTARIEIHGGLVAARDYFEATGESDLADRARVASATIAEELAKYWQPNSQLFAYLLDEGGNFYVNPQDVEARRAYTCLANLYAIGWISAADDNPWKIVVKDYAPDEGDVPQAAVEWWYMAALHACDKPEDVEAWRLKVILEAARFPDKDIYVQRPALQALALFEKSDWLPSIPMKK